MEKKELTRADFVAWGKKSSGGKKMKEKPREYFVEIGRKGGKARAKKLSTGTSPDTLA